MKFRERWLPACEFCSKANSFWQEAQFEQAEQVIGEHEQCVLCGILVGPEHYSVYLEQGRCNTCQPREVSA